jgi:hypothetical protein
MRMGKNSCARSAAVPPDDSTDVLDDEDEEGQLCKERFRDSA